VVAVDMAGQAKSVESTVIQLEHDIDEQYQYQPGEIIRGNIGGWSCVTLNPCCNKRWVTLNPGYHRDGDLYEKKYC